MAIPMRMMSSVAIVMAREKSGTCWELWRLLTRLVWKEREEERKGGKKGGKREEGRVEGREKGKKRSKREWRREEGDYGAKKLNEATFHKVFKSQDAAHTSPLSSDLIHLIARYTLTAHIPTQ